jgi:hypothetical protein
MRQAFAALDNILTHPVELIVGGGSAMVLAHAFPLATADIDAIPKGISFDEINIYVKQVAEELQLPNDWLNPYYYSFANVLPASYGERLVVVFEGKHILAKALGREDLLIMKCFAHRQKDVGHAKALLKAGASIDFVEEHIESLRAKGVKNAQVALDFLDDIRDQLGL